MAKQGYKLTGYMKRYRPQIAWGMVCIILSTAITVSMFFITQYAIDDLVARGVVFRRILYYALLYAFASLLSGLFGLFMRRLILNMSHKVATDIRHDVFAHLTRLDQSYYSRARTGDIMTRMTSDMNSIREFVGQGILQGTRTSCGFVFSFATMFYLNARIAAALLVLLPLITLAVFLLLHVLRKKYEASQEQFSSISSFCQESFSGIRTIKGFGAEERQRGRFHNMNREFVRCKMDQSRVERPMWPLMGLLFSACVLVLLVTGGRQVLDGNLTMGEFVQFLQNLNYLQWPMVALGWILSLIQRGRASWDRIRAILEAEPDVRDPVEAREGYSGPSGPIVFEHVDLTLSGIEILKDIQLTIPEGTTLGITGPTGSGKTLLISLIARLLDPTGGSVRIGKDDLRTIPLDSLRKAIGMAPQEPFLFSDTLASNIAYGVSGPSQEKVMWAADVAQLRPDIDLFPAGFDTMLGERGVTLSGGQRQRTAISRAIARNSHWLILDDVFSAIDTQTEARILEQLFPILGESTSIVVSHRVTTLRRADRIVVLEGGRITQEGSHHELIAQPGYYRELDEVQRLEARLEAG